MGPNTIDTIMNDHIYSHVKGQGHMADLQGHTEMKSLFEEDYIHTLLKLTVFY